MSSSNPSDATSSAQAGSSKGRSKSLAGVSLESEPKLIVEQQAKQLRAHRSRMPAVHRQALLATVREILSNVQTIGLCQT